MDATETLLDIAASGRANTPAEWTAYFRSFHEVLPNANELFTLLRTRGDDTSYTLLAKAVAHSTQTILDVGCGDGNLIEALLAHASADAEIFAIDTSAAQTAIARTRFASDARVHVEQGDASMLPYADGTFDCVIAHQFLNLLPDVGVYLSEIARVLKPGARLLFVANRGWQNDREATWIKIDEAAIAVLRDRHPNFVWPTMGDRRMYSKDGIRTMLTETGLFDLTTLSIGSFVSTALLSPAQVAAIYNRLYVYGLAPEKGAILEAVLERARALSTRGDLVELTLPFRVVSVRTAT